MEQATSRPAYLYIPEPIEQQLALYELGTLLEVYNKGWIGHDNRRPKLRGLLLNLVMLAVSIVSIIIIFYTVLSTGVLMIGLLFIPFVAIIGLVVGVPMLLQASLCIGAFSNGLVYAENIRVTVLYWSDIKYFEQETTKGAGGTLRILKVHAHDGRIFQVKAPYLQVDDLAQIIRENII